LGVTQLPNFLGNGCIAEGHLTYSLYFIISYQSSYMSIP
jgi:hypothetical protein